ALPADGALSADQWDDANAAYARAIELAGHRNRLRDQLGSVRSQISGLRKRARPEDLVQAQALFAKWLPIARALGKKRIGLVTDWLKLRWETGDVAAVDRETEALRASGMLTEFTPPYPLPMSVQVTGEVVDEHGAPGADAEVMSAPLLVGDSAALASPLYTVHRVQTRTGADGKFTLANARGFVIARLATLRSPAVAAKDHVRLVVHPT